MAYQVIARKYRPQRFSDVVGQEHVSQTLARAIEQKRVAHAYLFCGPRGTGKTTIARIFAKCLNCTEGPKVEFSDEDPRCREIAEGRSLDVFEIDGASNNGVEQVRELRETCKYAPAASRFKIYIIDEVHMLSTAAFNALLKTLEEPPEHVKFLFATTDPEKVLPTILSRCQRFDLRRIPVALIENHLAQIARQEKVSIAPAALNAIARGAEGGMRDAESTLDQLISFCGEKIEEQDVLSMFGLTAQGQLFELSRALLAGEVETALRQLNELAGHGKDLGRLLSDLLNHFRNLLIFQVSRGDLKMLEVSESEARNLAEQASAASAEGLTRIMEVFADAEMRLRDAASKKILVEVALLKAIEARHAVSLEAVLRQLRTLRDQNGSGQGGAVGGASAPAAAPVPRAAGAHGAALAPARPVLQPAPAAAAVPAAGASAAQELRETRASAKASAPVAAGDEAVALWASLVESLGFLQRSSVTGTQAQTLVGNLLTVAYPPEIEDRISLVDAALFHDRLQQLGRPQLQLKFVKSAALSLRTAAPQGAPAAPAAAKVAGKPANAPRSAAAAPAVAPVPAPAAAPAPPPPPINKEDFKNDPLIQKALEVFKAQIIDVRA